MAEVDVNDDSIKRFAIFHHRFDSETNHFKWIGIKAFSKKREWKKYLTKAGAELALKRASNEVSIKERITGRILEAGSTKNNKATRMLRRESQGIYRVRKRTAIQRINKLYWKRNSSKTYKLREIPLLILVALLVSMLIKTFLLQAFYIPSGSMEPTLVRNDRVVVNRFSAHLAPSTHGLHRGDVVVFADPDNWLGQEGDASKSIGVISRIQNGLIFVGVLPNPAHGFLIKRVIGMPSDHVVCCSTNKKLLVNGKEITEPYVFKGNNPSDIEFDITVPQKMIWVMGDHRGNSADSRLHRGDANNGFVPIKDVVGRAFIQIWPFARAKILDRSPE